MKNILILFLLIFLIDFSIECMEESNIGNLKEIIYENFNIENFGEKIISLNKEITNKEKFSEEYME